jgi:hypothetical protein
MKKARMPLEVFRAFCFALFASFAQSERTLARLRDKLAITAETVSECTRKHRRASKVSRSARFRLKCGVQHSDLPVVGRKSGPQKSTDDDICTICGAKNALITFRWRC